MENFAAAMRNIVPLALAAIVGLGCAEESAPATVEWQANDAEGVRRYIFEDADTKAAVLIFVLTDCPIANGYVPEINRLHSEYDPRGAALYVVHADPDVTAEQARQHARQYQLRCPVLMDGDHRLARRTGATKTPEAAVVSPQGEVLYLGRIDDLYAGYGKRRAAATSGDLRAALDAVLAGRQVPMTRTEVVGCSIPFRTEKDHEP